MGTKLGSGYETRWVANVDRFSPAGLGQFCWTLSLSFTSADQKKTDQIDSLLIIQFMNYEYQSGTVLIIRD